MVRAKLQLCVVFTAISTELEILHSTGQRPLNYKSRVRSKCYHYFILCNIMLCTRILTYFLDIPMNPLLADDDDNISTTLY